MQYLKYIITTRYTESSLQQNHGRMRQIVECQFNYVAAVAACFGGWNTMQSPTAQEFPLCYGIQHPAILLWWVEHHAVNRNRSHAESPTVQGFRQ